MSNQDNGDDAAAWPFVSFRFVCFAFRMHYMKPDLCQQTLFTSAYSFIPLFLFLFLFLCMSMRVRMCVSEYFHAQVHHSFHIMKALHYIAMTVGESIFALYVFQNEWN